MTQEKQYRKSSFPTRHAQLSGWRNFQVDYTNDQLPTVPESGRIFLYLRSTGHNFKDLQYCGMNSSIDGGSGLDLLHVKCQKKPSSISASKEVMRHLSAMVTAASSTNDTGHLSDRVGFRKELLKLDYAVFVIIDKID